uniref:Uncharacterized protein n=1 Tax=Oryzias latipes TaxID=8090 RepID=A0A3P9L6S8_ORYLA
VINKHIYLSDKGHSCISSIIISLSDGEWNKTIEVPTGLRDDVFASSLEVKVKTIKGVVVGISPSPAGGCVLGDAHSLTPLNTACLLICYQSWDLPAAAKGHSSTCLSSRRCCKVVLGIAIKITTETTSLATVSVGQCDHKIVSPVIADH